MPSLLLHYAAGVGIARAAGYRGWRAWGLGGGMAALPDLDVVTTVVEYAILAVATPSDGTIATLSFTLGHRGFSHTVGALLLATAGVLFATRRVRLGLLALGTYASHILLDVLTTWPVRPLEPFHPWQVEYGILTIWDPVFTTVALAYLAAAFVAERSGGTLTRPRWGEAWLSRRRTYRWQRAATGLAVTFLVLLAGAAGAKAAIAASTGSSFRDVEPVHFFQYTYLVREGDHYVVGLTPFLFSPAQTLTVPIVTLRENTTAEDAQLVFDAGLRLECTHLYNWYTNPIWQIRREGEAAIVEVRTAKAAATGLGEAGFALAFRYDGRDFVEAVLLEGGEPNDITRKELTALARCP